LCKFVQLSKGAPQAKRERGIDVKWHWERDRGRQRNWRGWGDSWLAYLLRMSATKWRRPGNLWISESWQLGNELATRTTDVRQRERPLKSSWVGMVTPRCSCRNAFVA